MREKLAESNALAAISRALKAQGEAPVKAPAQEAAAAPPPEKRKWKKDNAAAEEQGPPVKRGSDPIDGEGGPKKARKKKKGKKKQSGQAGNGLAGPSSGAGQPAEASPDPLRLCSKLVSLSSSLDTPLEGSAEAVLQQSTQIAAQLAAAFRGLDSGGAAHDLQVLHWSLERLRECLQGGSPLSAPYSSLQRSAATLQLATAATQLAHCAAALLLPQGPSQGRGHDIASTSSTISGRAAGGNSWASREHGMQDQGGDEALHAAKKFQLWYLSSFADSFEEELEALQESEAAPPAAVLRCCVAAQAALFSPAYQRLAMAASDKGS